jgi:hypothetical protein
MVAVRVSLAQQNPAYKPPGFFLSSHGFIHAGPDASAYGYSCEFASTRLQMNNQHLAPLFTTLGTFFGNAIFRLRFLQWMADGDYAKSERFHESDGRKLGVREILSRYAAVDLDAVVQSIFETRQLHIPAKWAAPRLFQFKVGE